MRGMRISCIMSGAALGKESCNSHSQTIEEVESSQEAVEERVTKSQRLLARVSQLASLVTCQGGGLWLREKEGLLGIS